MQRMGEIDGDHDIESQADYQLLSDDGANPFDRDDYDLNPKQPDNQLASAFRQQRDKKKASRHSRVALQEHKHEPALELSSPRHYQRIVIKKRNPVQIPDKLGIFDARVNQHIRDTTDPLGVLEHIVVLTAIGSSLATASTEHHFGENFVKLMEKGLPMPGVAADALSWIIASPASAVQFAFSVGTALNFDTRLLRAATHEIWHLLRHCQFDEFKKDLPYLARSALLIVIPSALPTVVMGYETFKTSPPWLRYMIEFGRFKGAVASNGSYYDRYEKDQIIANNKNPKKKNNTFNNYALTCLIESVRDKLRVLARDYPGAYIEALDQGLLDSLHYPTSFATKVETLLKLNDTLDKLNPELFQTGKVPAWIEALSLFLGFVTSLVNVKAATKVVELIDWQIVNNPVDFFKDWANDFTKFPDWEWKLIIGFMIGLIYCGYGSSKNNTLINRDASRRLISKIARFTNEGWSAHFASYTTGDHWRLGLICFSGVFYAATKGGSAVGYPVLPYDFISIPEACFMTVVFGGLAYMSLDNFLNTLSNRWQRYLFTDFLRAKDKIKYFYDLSENKQLKLIDLIDIYLNFALGQIIDLVNAYPEQETNEALPAHIIAKLEKLFPKPNQPQAAAEAEEQKQNVDSDEENHQAGDEQKYADGDPDQYEPPLPPTSELTPKPREEDAEVKESPMLHSLHKRHMSRHSATHLELPPPTTSPALTPAKGAPTFLNESIYRNSNTKRNVHAAMSAANQSRGASPRLTGSSHHMPSPPDLENGLLGSPPVLQLSSTKATSNRH
ncbi:MAG: hypothetical protein P4M14_06220 [Gammaproteobacteria bacterium]|nr:hypothetical protein [Gammaproteobacteria bacterium]